MSGIFGVVSEGKSIDLSHIGAAYLSHRGNQFGGQSIWHDSFPLKKIHRLGNSTFLEELNDSFRGINADYCISALSPKDEQPLVFQTKYGAFSLVTDGNMGNADELAQNLLSKGVTLRESKKDGFNVTEICGAIISQGKDYTDGIENLWDSIEDSGSISLLLLTEHGICAARDRRGTSSMAVGERLGYIAVGNETTPFYNLGIKLKKELKPGEICMISKEGLSARIEGVDTGKICAFNFVYNDFPSSEIESILVETARNRAGKISAERDKRRKINADYCAAVPDSGVPYAIGRSNASGIPLERPLLKYTPAGFGRSYFGENQFVREETAHYKIIALDQLIRGRTGIFDDDSLVRGTQMKKLVKKISDCMPKGIHLRLACPAIAYPCIYNQSTREKHELAVRRAFNALAQNGSESIDEFIKPDSDKYHKMVSWIMGEINSLAGSDVVKTLYYQRMGDMVRAIGLPEERLCTYCWTGKK